MTSINYQPLLNSSTNLKILLQNQNADGTISSLFSGSEPEDVLAAKAIFNQQPGSDGEVSGPASATDNAVARFDGTTGKLIQNSTVTIDDTGNITPSSSVHGANGSAANPSFAFNSDQNTGIYRIGVDNIGVAANGAKVLDIATTGLTVAGDVTANGVIKAKDGSGNPYALLQADASALSGGKTWTIASNATGSTIGTAGGLSIRDSSTGATVANFINTGLAITGDVSVLSSSNQEIATFAHPSTSTSANNGGAILTLQNTSNTNGNMQSLLFRNSTGTTSSGIFGYNTNQTTGEGFLTFGTRNSSGTFDERARIASSGNVGIGTASPAAKLHIIQTTEADASTGFNIQRTTNDSQLWQGYNTGSDVWQIASTYGSTGAYKPLTFWTSSTERMRIASNGDISISSTTAGSAGAGALVLQGGISAGNTGSAASYFGGTVKFSSVGAIGKANDVVTGGSGNDVALGTYGTATNIIFATGTGYLERARISDTGLAVTGALSTTGAATFAGAVTAMIAGERTSINDDSVATFTPLAIGGVTRGVFVLFNPDYGQSIICGYFSSGGNYLLYTIVKSADVTTTNTTTMTGTTGTDGKMNIGFNNGIIYIENRLGGSGNFLYLPFGGTN